MDTIKLFTFKLIDGRKVTYAGLNEKQAYRIAQSHHYYVEGFGEPAEPCHCHDQHADSVRQAGWLICRDCAGYIG